jgi:aspartyl/asparaginyl-tRNA synthetase
MAKVSAAQKRIDMITQFNKVLVSTVQKQLTLDIVWLTLRCDVHHNGTPAADKVYQEQVAAFFTMLVMDYLDNKVQEDGKTVAAVDCLVPGIGEIIGGSQREDDYDKLLARIQELGLNEDDYKFYLDLRKYGSVPHGGFGIGIERMVTFVAGTKHIREAIPFPRMLHRIKP